jgi:nucleoside-triphosphatase THEP1
MKSVLWSFFSKKFKQAVRQALESKKFVLAVVHRKANDPLVTQVKRRLDARIFNVTLANGEKLSNELVKKMLPKFQIEQQKGSKFSCK